MARAATKILASPSTNTSYTAPDGSTVHVNSRLIPEFDWYLIVEQSRSAAETRILNTLFINIGVALLITALVIVTAWFTIRGYQLRLESMATTDEVTGGASRQVFDMLFDQVVRTSRRTDNPVSLIALDIDRFKAVNDTHGHAAGDTVLRTLSAIVRENIRDADTVCRWGGDEFLLLLGDCSADDAERIAEKIRAAVDARTIRHGQESLAVTVSLGVAQHRRGEDMASLVARADEALYESKREGRDRVTRG